MLLRTVALLLLCVSLGMCATLGYYETEENKEAAPTVESTAANAQVGDSPADNSLFGNKLLAKILALDNDGVDQPAVEAHASDGAIASDKPVENSPATEALTKEAVIQKQPSAEVEANEIRPIQTHKSPNKPQLQEDDDSWSLNSIRNSFQAMHGYFDSLVELVGGRNGVCQYRCRNGEIPQPRPGYQLPEPNGCSSSLIGFQVNAALDVGIPAMTKCCDQLDVCYDTCGMNKYDCDARFRSCLHGICSDLKRSLGFVSKVQACESMADGLYNTVWTLGCRPYMNSQRAACVCEGEEKDEL
ncbi:group XIIB secretory phospholipase A2-like protein isoform X2 [Melanotaenia boesemani]|uniref:group XIIB secretory phospholipase A2-like protein isoform X2 n=1 Tax=Melanotaenia boesemani TaxID=1250792 RepID=UPI001C0426CB|nr:group XIIB secretory phospholipase A2-like protein isoform X2 [Melanotaenia boesemani]